MDLKAKNSKFINKNLRSEIQTIKLKKNIFSYRLIGEIHAITLRCAKIKQDLSVSRIFGQSFLAFGASEFRASQGEEEENFSNFFMNLF